MTPTTITITPTTPALCLPVYSTPKSERELWHQNHGTTNTPPKPWYHHHHHHQTVPHPPSPPLLITLCLPACSTLRWGERELKLWWTRPPYLFDLAELINASFVSLHAILCQTEVRCIACQLLLILRHLLDHLRQVLHWRLVLCWHPLRIRELLQLPRHLSKNPHNDGNTEISYFRPLNIDATFACCISKHNRYKRFKMKLLTFTFAIMLQIQCKTLSVVISPCHSKSIY